MLPVTGLQISAWAGLTNPELERPGEGIAPCSGRVRGLQPWETTSACTGRPKLSPQQGCESHICFPTMISGGFTQAHKGSAPAGMTDSTQRAPLAPWYLGIWSLIPAKLRKALKPDLPLAALPHSHQALCETWGAAIFSTELIAAVFCGDPNQTATRKH